MDNRPIGVFDSGLGGLTCVKELMHVLPGENIIYLGDTGRVLVRVSGTEPLLRVMVEGRDFDEINRCAVEIAERIKASIAAEE